MAKKGRKGSRFHPLLVIAVIAFAVYAIPRAYFTYRVDQALSRVESGNIAMVSVSYDSVWADFMGENADIYNVAIRVAPLDDALTIDRLSVHADGYGALGRLSSGMRLAEVPESLAIEIEGLRFDVGDGIYNAIANAGDGDREVALSRINGLGCDAPDQLTREIIERVTRDQVVVDGQLELGINAERGQVRPSFVVDIHDFGRMELAVTIRGEGTLADMQLRMPGQGAARLPTPDLGLADAHFRFEDKGANAARNSYCANRTDTDLAGFIDRHVEAVGTLMADTGERSPEFLEPYRQFSRHGGDIRISMKPGTPLSFRDLSQFTRDISIFRMNPEVAINGQTVPKVAALWLSELAVTPAHEVNWGESAVAGTETGDGSSDRAADATNDDEAAANSPNRQVEPGELASFIGYRARITTTNGEIYAGRIASAGEDSVKVRVGMEGGYVGYDIDHSDIREAIVRR